MSGEAFMMLKHLYIYVYIYIYMYRLRSMCSCQRLIYTKATYIQITYASLMLHICKHTYNLYIHTY
jgi:hypothetical protein